MPFKFGSLQQDGKDVEYVYPNVLAHQTTKTGARLCIGLANGHCDFLRPLTRELRGPFALLLVLHTPCANEPGRYQSPWLSLGDVEEFLSSFADFLERDARLDLWLRSESDNALLIYDRHNVLYAYGPLGHFEQFALSRGLLQGNIAIPVPHTHHYHAAYDSEEKRLLTCFEWHKTPLRPEDEQ